MADALENLTATLALGSKEDIPVCDKWLVTPSEEESMQEINTVSIYEVEKKISASH